MSASGIATPAFIPERFFVGRIEGWGILENPLGGLQARFTVRANGKVAPGGQTIAFTETWTMDNGIVETLAWSIAIAGDGSYVGSEPHLVGKATGQLDGDAFHWTYSRMTPQASGERVSLNFDDWFYMIDERVCIVRGTAGRIGLPFSIAHVTYQRCD